MRYGTRKRRMAFAAALCVLLAGLFAGIPRGTADAQGPEGGRTQYADDAGSGGAAETGLGGVSESRLSGALETGLSGAAETGFGGTAEGERVSEPESTEPQTEPPGPQQKVHLDVDVRHCYPHMDSSYEQGYLPKTEEDKVYLVVPLVADGPLRDDCVTAELVMDTGAPFVYANYRKEIKKETYLFEKSLDVYLFCCEIGLEKRRVNGKYPVDVRAYGYSGTGARTEFSCRLYITVSDGIDAPGPNGGGGTPGGAGTAEPDTEPESEQILPGPTQEPATEPLTEPQTEEPAGDPVISGDGGSYDGGYYGGGGETQEKIHRQPKLMLAPNELSNARISAGKEKEVTLSLQNTNAEETIYNLMVRLAPSQDISLTASSFYFGKVYPQEEAAFSTVLSAAAAAAAGSGSLSLSYEYENSQGASYSGSQEIPFEICQTVQAVMEGFSIADQVYAQETVESAVSVRNVGKTAIYNATVELQAPGLFATGSMFAGNLEAGASCEGVIRVYVGNKNMTSISDAAAGDENAYGKTSGTLTLSYENADGEVFRQTQEFSTIIREPEIVELAVDEQEEVQTNQWWTAILVLTALLFLLVIAFLAWRLRKSRNALADLLAEKRERIEI